MSSSNSQEVITLEIPIEGMDCVNCSKHVETALREMDGVLHADVYLAAEKAIIRMDPSLTTQGKIRGKIERAGYSIRDEPQASQEKLLKLQSRRFGLIFFLVTLVVLAVVVFGEWLGWLDQIASVVPSLIGIIIVLAVGWPVYKKVIHAASQRRITPQTLITLGIIGALLIGEWVTAILIVIFMRIGDAIERSTTDRSRDALRDLTSLSPQQASVIRDDREITLPIGEVSPGDTAIIRRGERIPVDGVVISGEAFVDQSTITGESLPVEVGEGSEVFAATIVLDGSLRVRTTGAGPDTTYGNVIKLVEEAEGNRSRTQRFADRFTSYFLPIVIFIALLTLLIRGDPLASVAVLVVSCSCAIALATPIAVMASIGAGAKQGLLIKGGRYLESLDDANVLLIDKTGTVTFGHPEISCVEALNGISRESLICLAASVEILDQHPYAGSIRALAHAEGITPLPATHFKSFPGRGVQANVDGHEVKIGNSRFVQTASQAGESPRMEADPGTFLYVESDNELIGILMASDTIRPEVPDALRELRATGIERIFILTGDQERSAAMIAADLDLEYRAGLLPEDKISIVKQFQEEGKTVVMVGDGVNDAPALAQADVGIAMGVAGSDIAIETADIALMKDDWMLIPEVFRISHRTMRVVRMNLLFTGVFNLVGISLAAFGILPPVLAAASHSLPDLAVIGNSSRLLDQ